MKKSYHAWTFFNEMRFSCISVVKACRLKLFFVTIFVLAGFGIGVAVAISNGQSTLFCNLQEIDVQNFLSGFTASASAFGARCLSLVINIFLLTILAFVPWLFPLACALFVYRAYLFGLNFSLIFIFYGIGSVFTAIVIILPCQLCTLVSLVLYYCLFTKINQNNKRFGCCDCPRWLVVICGLLIVLLINLIETLFLLLLSGRVILVI